MTIVFASDQAKANGAKGGRPTKNGTEKNPAGISLVNPEITQSVILVNPDKTKSEALNPNPKNTYSCEFESAWQAYPDKPGKSKTAAFKAWNAKLNVHVATRFESCANSA